MLRFREEVRRHLRLNNHRPCTVLRLVHPQHPCQAPRLGLQGAEPCPGRHLSEAGKMVWCGPQRAVALLWDVQASHTTNSPCGPNPGYGVQGLWSNEHHFAAPWLASYARVCASRGLPSPRHWCSHSSVERVM